MLRSVSGNPTSIRRTSGAIFFHRDDMFFLDDGTGSDLTLLWKKKAVSDQLSAVRKKAVRDRFSVIGEGVADKTLFFQHVAGYVAGSMTHRLYA